MACVGSHSPCEDALGRLRVAVEYDTERAGLPDMQEWYLSWPVDIRKKLSLHDLQRMWKTLRHPCNNVADWEIDSSAGRPILTYQKCSVIEDEQARYVLGLIAQDVTSGPRAGSVFSEEQFTELAGYFQDGSAETLTVHPDDATRTWHVRVGKRELGYSSTITSALLAAQRHDGEGGK